VLRQMKRIQLVMALMAASPLAWGQQIYLERLPSAFLPVRPPTERVSGEPGQMRVIETACQSEQPADARQRIVDIAVQEWAYFGFSVADETVERDRDSLDTFSGRSRRFGRGFSWLGAEESERLANSIAGYWAITGDGSWILNRQNEVWNGNGVSARWRDPWSAAFISWVMCESGLGDDARFDRAIAHHTYIDQAIRARDEGSPEAAFVAFDVGETEIEPGDLVCSARRPNYTSLNERRSQLGDGIRSHCDIVVKVEADHGRVLAIGGNVRGSVSLKLLPAEFDGADGAEPAVRRVGRGRSQIFAHLKLRADPVEDEPIRRSPTLEQLTGQPDMLVRIRSALDRAVQALGESVLF